MQSRKNKPAYKKGDKILYVLEGREAELGIVEIVSEWKDSACYSVEGKLHQWIQEEQIIGFEQKRKMNEENSKSELVKALNQTKNICDNKTKK